MNTKSFFRGLGERFLIARHLFKKNTGAFYEKYGYFLKKAPVFFSTNIICVVY